MGTRNETGGRKGNWVRVTRANPCPICGRPDWCAISADGEAAYCMRVQSEKQINGKGFVHQLAEKVEIPEPQPEQKRKRTPKQLNALAKSAFRNHQAVATRRELASELYVSERSLERLGVGWGWDDYRNVECSTWPEFFPNGEVAGITRRYKQPVFIRKGESQRVNKIGIKGGTHGLFFARRWFEGEGPVFLPEGGSDTAVLLTLGLRAVGRPSNLAGQNHLIELLRQTQDPVCVLGEWDEKPEKRGTTVPQCAATCSGCLNCWPGMAGAKLTAEALQRALGTKRVSWCLVPGAKDVREWLLETDHPDGKSFIDQAREQVRWHRRK